MEIITGKTGKTAKIRATREGVAEKRGEKSVGPKNKVCRDETLAASATKPVSTSLTRAFATQPPHTRPVFRPIASYVEILGADLGAPRVRSLKLGYALTGRPLMTPKRRWLTLKRHVVSGLVSAIFG